MTKEERIAKTIKKMDSALLHAKKLYEETLDIEVSYIVGDLQDAVDYLRSLHRKTRTGKKEVQMEMFG